MMKIKGASMISLIVRKVRIKTLKRARKSEYRNWVVNADKTSGPTQLSQYVTIVMATYNTPAAFLKSAVESVRAQSSPNWELSIVDDASKSKGTLKYLNSILELDQRIKIHLKSANGGISESLNKAIQEGTGDFIGVLDHDDALHPRAIELCLNAVGANPDAILIYSDEDKIDKKGSHSNPFFKPDFSPELLLSQMYLNHFTIMKASEVKKVGGFRKEFDGAQDHDLALRLGLSESNVVHVPHVLYHWRAWKESTAMSIDAKPWAQAAAQKVQEAAMEAAGLGGTSARSRIKGVNEVHWHVSGSPTVGVVIPTANRRDVNSRTQTRLVDDCLDSLRLNEGRSNLEVCVVHTGPLDSKQEFAYRNSGYKTVLYDQEKFNFSHAVNLGVSFLDTEFILLLNDDTRMLNVRSIDYMVEYAQNEDIGVVGAKLSYPNKRIQHVGIIQVNGLPTHPFINADETEIGYFGSLLTPRNYLAVTAAASMFRKEVFHELGGFDERFAHDFNDIDFCLRVRERGYRNVFTPFAHFEHVEGASLTRTAANNNEVELFRSLHGNKYKDDPYYSPRLEQEIGMLYEYK